MGTKIDQLPQIATTKGADELPISQDTGTSGRITYKTTLDQINNFVRNAGSIGTVTSVSVTSPDNSISTFGNPVVGSGTITLAISSVKLEKIDNTGATDGQFIKYNGTSQKWEAGNASSGGIGTVTSVSVTSPDNSISTSGNPIIGSGTITLGISSVKLEKLDNTGAVNGQFIKYNGTSQKWEAGDIPSSGFDALLSLDGYQKISSGLIMQWGTHSETATADTFYKIIFPLPFPNQCFNVSVTNRDNTSTNSSTLLANTPTISSVDIAWNTTASHSVFWQAIGY